MANTAVEKLRHVVELAPDMAEPHAFRAQTLLERGENADAAAEAERVLDPMSPRSAPA